MCSIPGESTPTGSPHPRTTRMSSGACERPSRRRRGKEGTCGTSPQSHPYTQTPLRHPARAGAGIPAAPTPPRPAAPREPPAPQSMTRLTPRPAAPPPNATRGYFLGHARATRQRHSLPPLAAAPSSPDPRPRTNPPRRPQSTASHRGPHLPRPSLTTPEAPDWLATAPPPAGRTTRDPTRPDDPAQHRPPQ